MVPFRSARSDALFNVGAAVRAALADVRHGAGGVFISMNGKLMTPECARKDYDRKVFVDVCVQTDVL